FSTPRSTATQRHHSFPTRRSSDLSSDRAARYNEGEEQHMSTVEAPVPERVEAVIISGPDRGRIIHLPELEREPTPQEAARLDALDRKSTRLNSSHLGNSYAVLCLK